MMDYRESRERGSLGAILPSQPNVEPADEIRSVNWPHSSKEHQRAVRWILAGERERWIMQEAEKVLMMMRDALLIAAVLMMASVGWGQPCSRAMEGMANPATGMTCSNGKWITTGYRTRDIASGVPQFKREYIAVLSKGRKMTITIYLNYASYSGFYTSKDGELTQPDGKWVTFDPDAPADKILDPMLVPEVERLCAQIIRDDRKWRDSRPPMFKDESGTWWQRVAKP